MRTIKGLQVRYIRGARKIDIHHPDPNMVEIAGANGAAKSSTLDAIEWGLRGKKALPEDALHHDATKGHVKLDLGDLTILRKITEENVGRGGTVKITAADGSKWGQKDVNELFGAWTFDPLAFAHLAPEQQVEKIRALAGKEFCAELAFIEEKLAVFEERRTEAGREVKRFGTIPDLPKVEEVDTKALLDEINAANAWNDTQARKQFAIDQARQRIDQWAQQRDQLTAQVAKLQDEINQLGANIAETRIDAMTQPEEHKDITDLNRRLADAGQQNVLAQEWKRAEEKRREFQEAVRLQESLQQEVEDLRERKSQHLRKAQLPVEGLTWEGGRIALNGTPFKGLSTTEQLLLSARIGMAMSPELRVMMVREGGLVDNTKFEVLRQLAAEEGYQIIMETAGDGHTKDALVIVDGELDDETEDDWSE